MKYKITKHLLISIIFLGIATAGMPIVTKAAGPSIEVGPSLFAQVWDTLTNTANTGTGFWDKAQEIGKIVVRKLAGKLILNSTQKIVNWGTTGFQGDPFFVRNQESFLESIDDQQLLQTVNAVTQTSTINPYDIYKYPYSTDGTSYFCKTIPATNTPSSSLGSNCRTRSDIDIEIKKTKNNNTGKLVAQSLVNTYITGKESIEQKQKFNLDKVVGSSWQDFANGDFSKGGWDAWDSYTQNSYNNPFGNLIQNSIDLKESQTAKEDLQKQELIQNNGFLSLKKCVAYKSSNIQNAGLNTGTSGESRSDYKYKFDLISGSLTVQCKIIPPPEEDFISQCKNSNSSLQSTCVATKKNEWSNKNCKSQQGLDAMKDGINSGVDNYTLAGGEIDNCARYETTTPGKIINEQLTKALNVPLDKALGSAQSGDSLINSLADLATDLIYKGLNNLATNTFSGSSSGPNGTYTGLNNNTILTNLGGNSWYQSDGGATVALEDTNAPGQPSQTLSDTISATENEIAILIKTRELLQTLPAKTQELDQCLPGPDFDWQKRLDKEFTKSSSHLDKKSNKDNDKADDAVTALNRLESYKDEESNNTKLALLGLSGQNIPSAALIIDRVNQIAAINTKNQEVSELLAKRASAIAILNDIRETIAQNPSKVEGGVLVQNVNQHITDLQKTFSQVTQNAANQVTVDEAQANYDLFVKNIFNSFDKTNPKSLISRCIEERRARPDLVGKDQGQTLFCPWQTPTPSGTTTPGIFQDPITTLYVPGGYTQDEHPYETSGFIGIGAGNTKGFELDCVNYYRAPIGAYLGSF